MQIKKQQKLAMDFYCIRVGYGYVASIHQQVMERNSVATLGYFETSLAKQQKAIEEGYKIFASYEEAFDLTRSLNGICIWDICSSTEHHISVLRKILNVTLCPCVLIEKPVCLYTQIVELKELVSQYPEAKIVVNENYLSSNVTIRVREFIKERQLTPIKILVEMTKHRLEDYILHQRFLDIESGVFGYELSHMLAILRCLDLTYLQGEICTASLTDASFTLPNGQQLQLSNQGTGEVEYRTNSGIEIALYTSMVGEVGYPCFPYSVNYIPFGNQTKYRVLAVECLEGITIVGLYEPILGFKRFEGVLLAVENCPIVKGPSHQGKVVYQEAPIWDNTMEAHLQKTLNYFSETEQNCCDLEMGIEFVDSMYSIASKAKGKKEEILHSG